jgi:diguanylate cyclase (GGDEF)-like protein
VLLVAPGAVLGALERRVADALPAWEVIGADGIDRARFALQLEPCDVLILDADLARTAGALDWIAALQPLPITLLSDDDADFLCAALDRGATNWAPRALALRHTALLASVLRRAASSGELRRQMGEAEAALADCRRHVSRLVNRLWDAVPCERGANWFSQRHMMERLQEEMARVGRHGGPLTVILGELVIEAANGAAVPDELASWAADLVARSKRRSDVAGQYGPNGFIMVLPRTPQSGARGCCRRLAALLEELPTPLRGPVRACFGLAAVDDEQRSTITMLLSRAEEDLEEAKNGAR